MKTLFKFRSHSKLVFLFGLLLVIVGSFSLTPIINSNLDSVRNQTLIPGEIIKLRDFNKKIGTENVNVALSFPQNQANSKLISIKNNEDTEFSVFLIDGGAFLYFQSPNNDGKVEVLDPISVPVSTNNGVSEFSIEVSEKLELIVIESEVVSHRWTPPQELRDLNLTQIQSGNAEKIDLVLKQNVKIKNEVVALFIFLPMILSIVVTNRSAIRLRAADRIKWISFSAFPSSNKLILGSLVAGFGLIALIPPSPPSGNLIHSTVDAAKIESSDLQLINEEFKGGWLFANPPQLGLLPEDYTTTFVFDLSLNLDSDERFTEIFALGQPQSELASPRSRGNFELSMNAEQRISFQVPGERAKSTWFSTGLKPGTHRVQGEIRYGREIELLVDGILVNAMAANTQQYLLQRPNLFMSDYLINNLESGSFSWSIESELAKPIAYGIYRLQLFLGSLLLLAGFSALTSKMLARSICPTLSNDGSHKVLRASFFTFFLLSGIGVFLWSIAIQPATESGWPRNTPLFWSQFRFSDLTQIFLSSQHSDPYTIANVTYPPFGMVLFKTVGFLSAKQATILVICSSLSVIFSVFVRILQLRPDFEIKEKIATVSMLLLSYPLLFAVDRGNLDLVLTALLLLAVWVNFKDGPSYRAGLLIGLASAIKIYPLLLLPTYYYNKRDPRLLVTSISAFCAFSILGAWQFSLGPGQFLKTVILGSAGQGLEGDYAIRWNGSLAGFVTTLARAVDSEFETRVWRVFSSPASTLSMILVSIIILIYAAMVKMEKAKFTLISIALLTLIFPSTPAYRFTIFLVAIAFLLLLGINDSRDLTIIGVLLGVILSPVVYWYFGMGAVSTYSIIIPLATLSLMIFLLKPVPHLVSGRNENVNHGEQDSQANIAQ
jgi:hypothetical protein